ncbi:uncharacterized protein LOC135374076 [Ornithodoros turicata]|uniref:uncharacterized protein LOC135374076 n=1 Tax=Ornithodoros turicata TaxID=34597 RepID=UPI003139B4FE
MFVNPHIVLENGIMLAVALFCTEWCQWWTATRSSPQFFQCNDFKISVSEDVVQHALVSDKECLGLQNDSDALPIITVDQGTACPVDSTRTPPMFTGSRSASTSGALARPACTVQPGEMRPSPTREHLQLEEIQYEMYSVVDRKV